MSRRESRELAFKLLYQYEIQKQDTEKQKENFISEQNIKENELEYFDLLVKGVCEKKLEIDNVYSSHLKKWNLDRIAKVDQTILRIATYEIMNIPMVPFNVSISEAVFLSKKYSTDEARSFINGILGNLSYLRPNDNKNNPNAIENIEEISITIAESEGDIADYNIEKNTDINTDNNQGEKINNKPNESTSAKFSINGKEKNEWSCYSNTVK